MPVIRSISARPQHIPLRRPFATAQDKEPRTEAASVAITAELDDGRCAVAEAVPVQYVTGETVRSVLAAVERAGPSLAGADVRRLRPLCERLRAWLPDEPTARAGLELCCWDAWCVAADVPLWYALGGAQDTVETDTTLSISDDAVTCAEQAALRGFRHFKIKVGGPDAAAELERVVGVQRAVPEATIRLDANQGFGPEDALRFIDLVLEAGVRLAFVEQPVPQSDLAALDRVAARSPVPILADEAVKTPQDAIRLVRETQVHGINVKLMKAGMLGALEIVAIAQAAGLKLMLGCMLESRRGTAFSLALACGTGAFDYVDLDSHELLVEPGDNRFFHAMGPRLAIAAA